ncbi:phosphonate ABC transporter, permease protein PhnE [Paracoccus laeviglucosivorans]|uniref:Phosphonate transport system permease protein n=1 Tax=Paracoccus laeviglucosivorans TaxID=1197861 RepID=A0A521B267_9RHOB|nr:phosphonate ABC transporter, permease protein PhnE [Paracoccus laeviglucosivorans]SMO41139.1 phosphonate transport system permease protein [Paracoccus laeviglucosivorans]
MATIDTNIAAGRLISRKRFWSFGVPAMVVVYLAYVAVAFDLGGLAGRARLDNGALLMQDFWSYKIHVTRDNRRDEITSSIEGMRNATFSPEQRPDFVSDTATGTRVELPQGNSVEFGADGLVTLTTPDGSYQVRATRTGVESDIPNPPKNFNISDSRVTAYLPEGARLTVTRARTEVFRRQAGWELFFFDLSSEFYGKSWGELGALAVGPRIQPDQSNIGNMAHDFWTNGIWHHGDVAWAIFETILMAFLGTFAAGLISVPLAFLAASNFTPLAVVRQAVRRIFDLLRGVDALIWTVIMSRAFGPGPLTGSLAILLTDTGTFGKLFSEALENVDEKPIEGLRSTGAGSIARIRWAVIPQVAPVILSQLLYYFESNTRGATVIGAITGGGIGLLLMQAMQTQQDWEHVAYYILLIVLMVMVMDWVSGRLRARLIKG